MEDNTIDKIIRIKNLLNEVYKIGTSDNLTACGYFPTIKFMRLIDDIVNAIDDGIERGYKESRIETEDYRKV